MPYSTWTRPYQGIALPAYQYFNTSSQTVTAHGDGITVLPGSETTYSYRNSRRGAEDDGYENLPGNRLAQRVGDEYHETRGGLDNGHEFWTRKDWWEISPQKIKFSVPYNTYEGPLYPSFVGVDTWPDLDEPTDSELNVLGARSITGTLPDRPIAGLAAFLGELREGFPRLVGASLAKHGVGGRTASQEFLNEQFGIRPMISDITKLATAVTTGDILLQRYLKEASLLTRRKLDLGTQRSASVHTNPDYVSLNMGTISGSSHPYGWLSGYDGYFDVVDTLEHSARFAGQYERFIPINSSFFKHSEEYARKANKLLGTNLTPSVVWQITPWSWLLDWLGNFNVFMTNVSYLNGNDTILRYGYLTHKIHAVRTWTRQSPVTDFYGNEILNTVYAKHHVTVLRRVKASPYGFGINLPDMSPLRWAILAALGKTRAPAQSLRSTDRG